MMPISLTTPTTLRLWAGFNGLELWKDTSIWSKLTKNSLGILLIWSQFKCTCLTCRKTDLEPVSAWSLPLKRPKKKTWPTKASWNWTKSRLTCTDWSTPALFILHEVSLKFTRNTWMGYLALVLVLFATVRNVSLLVFLMHWKYPDSKFFVPVAKRYIFLRQSRLQLMAHTLDLPSLIPLWCTTP